MSITSKNKYLLNDMNIIGTCSIPLKCVPKHTTLIYIYLLLELANLLSKIAEKYKARCTKID